MHLLRASLLQPPHRRKKRTILEPDRSCANRPGHLDVLTITLYIVLDTDSHFVVTEYLTLRRPTRHVLADLATSPAPFVATTNFQSLTTAPALPRFLNLFLFNQLRTAQFASLLF